jgi:hypothetical protein
MISEDYNIAAFINAVKGKDYSEIIELADQEATIADRCRYRKRRKNAEASECGMRYSSQLKDLIFYLRYNIKPANARLEHFKLYRELVDTEKAKSFQVAFRSLGHSIYHLPFKHTA